ncbi:MAG: hypothetical protein ACI4NJ_00775 [Cellvibrio sp.]
MNINDLGFSFSDVQWLLSVVIGVYAWMVRRASASNAEVVALRERLIALEVDMRNMPSEASVRELIGRLERLTAYNEGTKQQLDSVQHSVNRINEFLLNQR